MESVLTTCFKVSDGRICRLCKSTRVIKNGSTRNRKQQYFCKECGKRFIEYYTYQAYNPDIDRQIVLLTKEGLGIRSTARVLQISVITLLKRLVSIAQNIPQPIISKSKTYEVDEICTYVKCKSRKIWIVYALERQSKTVVRFCVGTRTNKTLGYVLNPLTASTPKKSIPMA